MFCIKNVCADRVSKCSMKSMNKVISTKQTKRIFLFFLWKNWQCFVTFSCRKLEFYYNQYWKNNSVAPFRILIRWFRRLSSKTRKKTKSTQWAVKFQWVALTCRVVFCSIKQCMSVFSCWPGLNVRHGAATKCPLRCPISIREVGRVNAILHFVRF